MPFGLGFPELVLITFLALVFFGKDRITSLAKDVGQSVKIFKNEIASTDEESAEVEQAPVKAKTKKITAKKATVAKKAA